MKTLYIGRDKPWRLTKESGYRLAKALVETSSIVVNSIIDSTCPPTHAILCVGVKAENVKQFEQVIGRRLEKPQEGRGMSECSATVEVSRRGNNQ